jgi:hypothetical protein
MPLTHLELPKSIIVHVLMLLEHHAPTESSCGVMHSGERGLVYEKEYIGLAASSESNTPVDEGIEALPSSESNTQVDEDIEAFPAGQATHAVKEGN